MADEIRSKITNDSTQMRADFEKARRHVGRFTRKVRKAAGSVGAFAAGFLGLSKGLQLFEELANKFDRIDKLAKRLDEPPEGIQRLGHVAEVNGASLDELANALTRLERKSADVGTNKALAKAFADLNINAKQFRDLSMEGRLEMLADSFKAADDRGVAFARLFTLLEDDAKKLIPLLEQGAEGIRKTAAEIDVLSGADVKAIADFNDQMTLLKANFQAQVGRELAADMEGLKDTLKAVGEKFIALTQFVIRNREALEKLAVGVGALLAIKWTAGMADALLTLATLKTRMVLATAATAAETTALGANTAAHAAETAATTASTAATTAETTAVTANTAAYVANARARALGAVAGKGRAVSVGTAANLAMLTSFSKTKFGGTRVGGLVGKAMGRAAAAKFGLSFIARFSPHALAAAVGVAIGKPLGEALANRMAEAADEKTSRITEPLHRLLKVSHELVNEARTQKETDEARAFIKKEIVRLTEQELVNASGQKRAEIEHTIAVLKRRDAAADTLRIRNMQRDAEEKIAKEMRRQHEEALRAQERRREDLKLAEERLKKERDIAHAMRQQISQTRSQVIDTQIDLLPSEQRIRIFEQRLKSALKSAEFSLNIGRPKGTERREVDSLGDVFRLAQEAQAQGRLAEAKHLLELLRKMQEIEAEIRRAKDETLQKERERKQEAQDLIDFLDQQLEREKQIIKELEEKAKRQNESKRAVAGELAVLRLRAQGRNEEAEALQQAIEVRREAKRIAEQTGVSEQKALEIAREKARLQQEINRQRERASRPRESLRERIRRERAERIERQREKNLRRAQRDPNRRRLGLGGRPLRERQKRRAERAVRKPQTVEDRLDRMIGQQDELLGVWKNIVTSS